MPKGLYYVYNTCTHDSGVLMSIKRAFTLGEVLIVFIIIGIIAGLSLLTIKPWEKQYKMFYQRMYHSIQLAVYNHMLESSSDENAFPSSDKNLCKVLLEYINTSNNAQVSSCDTMQSVGDNPSAATFADKNPAIQASNGTKIWIGSNGGAPFVLNQVINARRTLSSGTVKNEQTTDSIRYYFVYVDINGDRSPNTPVWSDGRMADIVGFIVTDTFEVIPIGYPQVDIRYLSAHVVYPPLEVEYSVSDTISKNVDEEVSDPMTYYEAKVKAYGQRTSTTVTGATEINAISGVVATYDWDSSIDQNSPFRVRAGGNAGGTLDDYDSFYEDPPTYDPACTPQEYDDEGNPVTSTTTDYERYANSVCSVRVYEYH